MTVNALINEVFGKCGPVHKSINFPHLYAVVLALSGIFLLINYYLKGFSPNNSNLKLYLK